MDACSDSVVSNQMATTLRTRAVELNTIVKGVLKLKGDSPPAESQDSATMHLREAYGPDWANVLLDIVKGKTT